MNAASGSPRTPDSVSARLLPADFDQQHVVPCRGGAVHHRRQGFDIDLDGVERVLGGGGALRQNDGDGLADIADLVVGDDGRWNGLKAGEDFCRSGMVGISGPISAAVITACTPGRVSAARVSIERMRPW